MAKLRVDKIAAPIIEDEFTGSVQFDGTSDYLDIASSTDFAFGTGDFTIEVWVYLNSTTVGAIYSNEVANSFFLYLDSGNLVVRNYDTSNLFELTGPSLRAWTHIALSRSGTDLRLFFNGEQQGSTVTNSTNWTQNGAEIGAYNNGTQSLNGYISNLRIIKGKALYTAAFTPPTRELGVTPETVLLACQSSTDATADATERHEITANGNATAADANPGLLRRTNISSTTTENTGSVFFDGTDDGLVISDHADFDLGTGDFTLEGWYYLKDAGSYQSLMDWRGNSGSDGIYPAVFRDNTGDYIYYYVDSSRRIDNIAISYDTWFHLTICRSSGTTKLFIDGVEKGSFSDSFDYISREILLGFSASNSNDLTGYISNYRAIKGHALYTSNFAPPTKELEVVDGTVLLCCYDGENIFAEKTGKIISAIGDRLSSPTPTATDSPIGITTFQPGLTRDVDPTAGPVFQGGAGFTSQNWLTLPKGTTTDRNRTGGRGLFGGGNTPGTTNTIDFVTIATIGNAQDFGDLTSARQASGLGSATRGVFGGTGHPNGNIMDYVTLATTSNAVDFGDLQSSLNGKASAANSTRGIFSGGGTPTPSNEIDFITIATLGNATDFGNLTVARRNHAGVASPTRAVFAGGDAAPTTDTIDYITIATTGNATDFGNLSAARETGGGASSTTRGVFMGGYTSPGDVDVIEYITISTIGNATDFGNLSAARRNGCSVSNKIRGLYAGGHPAVNTIEFVTIASTGDSTDFGDLLTGRLIATNGASDSHGGLS